MDNDKEKENKLKVWKRKIWRKIFGGGKVEGGFRRGTNGENAKSKMAGTWGRVCEKRWVKREEKDGEKEEGV